MEPLYSLSHAAPNIHDVVLDFSDKPVGFTFPFLLRTDVHFDNPKCRRDILTRHMDQAVERGAGVIDAGDFHCAMNGKYDKRQDKSGIRDEYKEGRYLDLLVKHAAEYHEPYAKHMIVQGRGNHEQAIKKNHETDLTERTVAIINDKHGGNVAAGGYRGWVRFKARYHTTSRSANLHYVHGWGGGGPVTKNMIQAANRIPVSLWNAHVIFTGHVHEAWHAEQVCEGITSASVHEYVTQHIIQGPTYKHAHGTGYEGWDVETGKPPKPLGAWWLKIGFPKVGGRRSIEIAVERAP